MLYLDPYPADLPVHFPVFVREGMEFRCFFRGEDTLERDEGAVPVSEEIPELSNSHVLGDGTVVPLSVVRFGEEEDPFVLVRDDAVLDRVGLLFPGVVFLLYLVFFRPLYFPFAPVKEELSQIRIRPDEFLDGPDFPLRKDDFPSERFLEERKVFHYPVVSAPLARPVPKESHHLEREIEPHVSEDEEKLFPARCEKSFPSASDGPFPHGLGTPSFHQVLLHDLGEGRNEIFEIGNRYSGEPTEYTRGFHGFFEIREVGEHKLEP